MDLKQLFTNIADAIRSKTGKTDKIVAENFADEINSIQYNAIMDTSGFPGSYSAQQGDYYLNRLLKEIPKNINTTGWKAMNYMFSHCMNLTEIDLSQWDTSSVLYMDYMFVRCTNLKNIIFGENFNTSNVTDMDYMFSQCSSLTELDLSNFDTSAVKNMGYMFERCNNLEELKIDNWNTESVTNMNGMFYYCKKIKDLYNVIKQLNTKNVTGMSNMFQFCDASITELPEIYAGSVNTISGVFTGGDSPYYVNFTTFGGFKDLGKAYTVKTSNRGGYILGLTYCRKLTRDSMMNVINGLYDLNLTYDVDNGGTLYSQSVKFYTHLKELLTDEDIAIATEKGWNVVFTV